MMLLPRRRFIAEKVRTSSYLLPLILLPLLFLPSIAQGSEPWWQITSSSRPSYLPSEGEGVIALTIENFGDAPVGGPKSHVSVKDVLPEGLQALTGPQALRGTRTVAANTTVPLNCTLATLTCVLEESLAPYQQLEVRIKVKVLQGAHSGELNRVSVSGAGAAPASLERPITVSEAQTPFGLEDFELRAEEEGGALATRAGSHPFQVSGTLVFNQGEETQTSLGETVFPAALPKDIETLVPPGLIGDPTPLASCSTSQFTHLIAGGGPNPEENACPAASAVGVAAVTVMEPGLIGYVKIAVPIFNLEPAFGEPARFGFAIPLAKTTIVLDTKLRSGPGEDYGVTISSLNTTEEAGTLQAQVTFWGVPGDPRHDSSRGWSCLSESEGFPHGPCVPSEEAHPPAFLTMPTSCAGPLQASVRVNSWLAPQSFQSFPTSEALQSLDGCNQLPFSPTISAQPSTDRASAPSGLDFNLDFQNEGLTSAEGVSQSHLKDISVTLPEGLTVNPSAGVGLAGCRPSQYAAETISSEQGQGCPNASKLGTVEVTTPLLPVAIHGSLYIAQPFENPFGSLLGLYVVLKNPEKGILIKLAGKVTPNPVTGRLTTTFENNPPLAFTHFNFHFREGQQAPLISPPACGTYTTQAELTPFSEPASPLTDFSSFAITKGFDGGPCPAGVPFTPSLAAGTLSNSAGSFSSFYLHLTRSDADQEISGFSTNLPPGLTGDLTGVPFCPEGEIEAVRKETGIQAEEHPICPAGALGHSLVGTGVGSVLAYTPGKLYLAGPYNGHSSCAVGTAGCAPFSLVSVTSAVVGPFDLGTVVLRFGLNINPYTAQVSVSPSTSEPIPTIIQGIVTHVRDIRVYVDRPGFIMNPTNCEPMTIGSTLSSPAGTTASTTSHFQAVNCGNLKFEPKISVSTSGKTSKVDGASLTYKIAYPNGPQGTYADIRYVKVELPGELPSRLTTLQKACTQKQFQSNPAGCPAASNIGHAKASVPNIPVPLEGPVYFVSNGGEAFPNLVMVLQGYGVTVELVGDTLIKKGVTSTTFKAVPDNPVSAFEIDLPEGPYSALAANGNLCKPTVTKTVKKKVRVQVKGRMRTITRKVKEQVSTALVIPSEYIAQSGALYNVKTPVTVTGCPKSKPKPKKKVKKARVKRHGRKK